METIGQIILNQLGGNKFIAMTGAKDFVRSDAGKWLQFKLPSNFAKDKINCVKITLTPADLYDVEYLYIRGMNVKEVAVSRGIYADMLQADFKETTGLDTHL